MRAGLAHDGLQQRQQGLEEGYLLLGATVAGYTTTGTAVVSYSHSRCYALRLRCTHSAGACFVITRLVAGQHKLPTQHGGQALSLRSGLRSSRSSRSSSIAGCTVGRRSSRLATRASTLADCRTAAPTGAGAGTTEGPSAIGAAASSSHFFGLLLSPGPPCRNVCGGAGAGVVACAVVAARLCSAWWLAAGCAFVALAGSLPSLSSALNCAALAPPAWSVASPSLPGWPSPSSFTASAPAAAPRWAAGPVRRLPSGVRYARVAFWTRDASSTARSSVCTSKRTV